MKYFLEVADVDEQSVRFRSCHIISELLDNIPQDADIRFELPSPYEQI